MLVFLIILGAVIALIFLLFFVVDYYDELDPNSPKIKFKSFRIFYDINPKRWRLGDYFVVCKDSNKGSCYWSLFNVDVEYRFYFNFIDSIRYRRWHKNIDKYNTSQANAQITAKMLAAVKQDIAKVEQLAQSEFNQANDIIQEVRKESK
jgi:hypothetical protein